MRTKRPLDDRGAAVARVAALMREHALGTRRHQHAGAAALLGFRHEPGQPADAGLLDRAHVSERSEEPERS